MVTRKPLPQDGGANPSSSPPYPVTPLTMNPPTQLPTQHAQNAPPPPDLDSDTASAWRDEEMHGKRHPPIEVPESLRAGPPGYSQHGSEDMLRPTTKSTNPYLQKMAQGGESKDSSASAWGGFVDRPSQPSAPPPPPPIAQDLKPPTQGFSNLPVSESSTNPWQPALAEKTAPLPSTQLPTLHTEDSGNNVWSTPASHEERSSSHEQAVLVDIEDEGNESPAWDEDSVPSPTVQEMPADNTFENRQILEDQHAWDESQGYSANPISQTLNSENHQTHPSQPTEAIVSKSQSYVTQPTEGWNLIDHEPLHEVGHQQSGIVQADGRVLERDQNEEPAPSLPPRRSNELPPPQPPRHIEDDRPPQPPRPILDTRNTSTSSIASPSSANTRKQKKETYEIKKVSWHDVTAQQNPRISPILVQNANGPCPLLALVNALTLSTPANVETALVETLRSREQVSLGLLLDAVFDELMSGRRGDAAQELPDVGDLYSFLITLHTGMNVNPRFFPPPLPSSATDPRNSMSHVHPAERDDQVPGMFEETREMKLYSTFSIPLIHGWLPDRDSPAYLALKRTAQSYEDAQNSFFNEEELESKLASEGLSFEEQAKLEDITTIKAFFDSAATQLTPYGLEMITKSLTPGSVAILFRNDHFSTLYRHPDTLQLLQLVTDMGYAGHEEVVWESLIDVNGENAEFLSGDFCLVGGPSVIQGASQSNSQSNEGWTTVPIRGQNRSANQKPLNIPTSPDNPALQSPRSPNAEQEDHDLALALQLQEEEEERHRNELARRRREMELSQQYIEQQGRGSTNVPVNTRGGGPPARGNGRTRAPSRDDTTGRPSIPPRRNGPQGIPIGGRPVDPEAGVDAPPPSYEQAANQAAYIPPANHPAHPNASPNGSRRASAYSGNSGSANGRLGRRAPGPTLIEQLEASSTGRRRNTATSGAPGLTQAQQDERGKDCVVM